MKENLCSKGSKNEQLEQAVRRYQQDLSPESLQQVMESGTALVYHYAGLFGEQAPAGSESDDLVQAGFEGLLNALRRFEFSRGVRFATYASHCIMGSIRHEIRRQKSYDRPSWAVELQSRILQATEDILQETGEAPTRKQIAEAVNIKEEGVVQAMQAGRIPLEELELSHIRNLRTENFQLPIEDRIMVRQALERLGNLQQRVVYLLFYRDMTQQEVADQMGLNQRKVSRLRKAGLEQMSKYLS